MASLDPDSLTVSSFVTAQPVSSVPTVGASDNCVSPLCMTEGRECTTPWCKDVDAVDTVKG